MVKHGGDAVVEWMTMICDRAWRQERYQTSGKGGYSILSLNRGKGSKDECNNYRGISLLSVPGRIHGRVLSGRLMQVTEKKVSGERAEF